MSEKIGLIAGKGQFPLLFAQAARARGASIIAAAHRGETDPALAELVQELHWVYVGQLGKIIRIFKDAGVQRAVMAGGYHPGPPVSGFPPGSPGPGRGAACRGRQRRPPPPGGGRRTGEGRHHHRPLHPVPGATPGAARQTEPRAPTREEFLDIDLGFRIAKEIGRLDLGQCVVVRRQVVVALEAVEGTDECIRRAGALAGPGAVVVKVSKPNQDLRFDVPAVGPDTIRSLAAARAAVLAIEAGKTLTFDRPLMLAEAQPARIAIWGV